MKKIPVVIVSGFLGSGKTSFLQIMIEQCIENKLKPGVVLNELSEENVEDHLFSGNPLYEILGGCICCTLKSSLKQVFEELLTKQAHTPIDILFIEGTGVANPLELKNVVIRDEFKKYFEFHSLVTLVDASNFLDFKSILWTSKNERELMRQQIISADLICVNKTDLVKQVKLDKVIAKLNEDVQSSAIILKTTHAAIPLSTILRLKTDKGNENVIKHPVHHSGIKAVQLKGIKNIERQTFIDWFNNQPDLLRAKGIITFKEDKQFYSFQYAANQLAISPVRFNRDPIIVLIGNGTKIENLKEDFIEKVDSRKLVN
ncbi:GTP-binding protein [Aeromicrobium ponti]|uniref:G3E family GTPase n=1 Tax=Cytobacillus oceanisediminis TaxID=665099 RepID=A0A562JIV8_9BACI|nr:GTP-binding protein [Cytobacillus oceanisediminis]TWH83122.1 G3E family GTPase [Cytobacillus oceanisediminis]